MASSQPTAGGYKSDKWHYIGDDGQEYGPFTTSQMQHMVDEGVFMEDTFIKDASVMNDYTEIMTAYPDADLAFLVAPLVPPELKLGGPGAGTEYKPLKYARGSKLEMDDIFVEEDDEAVIVPPIEKWAPEARYATWFYIAPDGMPHGPYESAVMRSWYDQGYFDPFEIQLRHVQSMPTDQYLPLPAFWANIELAFFTPIETIRFTKPEDGGEGEGEDGSGGEQKKGGAMNMFAAIKEDDPDKFTKRFEMPQKKLISGILLALSLFSFLIGLFYLIARWANL